MNLIIDNNKIEESFDKIAKELLTQKALFINDKIIRFTEMNFTIFIRIIIKTIILMNIKRNLENGDFIIKE